MWPGFGGLFLRILGQAVGDLIIIALIIDIDMPPQLQPARLIQGPCGDINRPSGNGGAVGWPMIVAPKQGTATGAAKASAGDIG